MKFILIKKLLFAFVIIISVSNCGDYNERRTIRKLINEFPKNTFKTGRLGRIDYDPFSGHVSKIVAYKEKSVPILLESMKGDNPAIIAGCIVCLEEIGDTSCIPALEKELDNYNNIFDTDEDKIGVCSLINHTEKALEKLYELKKINTYNGLQCKIASVKSTYGPGPYLSHPYNSNRETIDLIVTFTNVANTSLMLIIPTEREEVAFDVRLVNKKNNNNYAGGIVFDYATAYKTITLDPGGTKGIKAKVWNIYSGNSLPLGYYEISLWYKQRAYDIKEFIGEEEMYRFTKRCLPPYTEEIKRAIATVEERKKLTFWKGMCKSNTFTIEIMADGRLYRR